MGGFETIIMVPQVFIKHPSVSNLTSTKQAWLGSKEKNMKRNRIT